MSSERTKASETVEVWNRTYPVGTPITVRLYHGEILTSRTLTKARVSEMGLAVIEVEEMEGVIGGYFLLENVEAAKLKATGYTIPNTAGEEGRPND